MKKNVNSNIYVINNIPMFQCKKCNEFFYPDNVLKLFRKINWEKLSKNLYEFEYLERNAPSI